MIKMSGYSPTVVIILCVIVLTAVQCLAQGESCGANNPGLGFRIINGQKTSECQYPWMVRVVKEYSSGSQFGCGGSIIDNKHILTAAHCVTDRRITISADKMEVRTPTPTMFMLKYDTLKVEKVFVHKDYNYLYNSDDIAVLRLEKKLRFDSCRGPVCLTGDTTIKEGRKCRVMGWGRTETGVSSDALLWKEDPMTTEAKCKSKFNLGRWNAGNVCGQIGAFCNGDSGGPYVCLGKDNKYYQYGVVSEFKRDDNCSKSGKYSFVPFYKSWIESVMKS